MVAFNPGLLRRMLVEQNFRIEEKDTREHHGWTVKAPPGRETPLNPSGIVQVHVAGLTGEKHKWTAILGELKKIGFDPELPLRSGTAHAKNERSLTEQTGLEEFRREVPEGDPNPDDRWVRFEEAGEAIGISGSGIAQRVKAGKLRDVALPTVLPAFGGGSRTSLVRHVNLADVKASGAKGSQGGRRSIGATKPATISRRFENTAAGRLKEATVKFAAAKRKIDAGFAEMDAAMAIIDRETNDALQELYDVKQRHKRLVATLQKGVDQL